MESGSSVFPLTQMARSTPTEFWNDSCAIDEMTYAIANGAVGATTNPVIVATVLKKEFTKWEPRIREIMVTRRSCTEDDVAWAIIEDMGAKGAELLLETFKASKGKKGRLSIQANPKYFRDSQKMVEQALRLNAQNLGESKIVEEVIPEPLGGAHNDPEQTIASVRAALQRHLAELQTLPLEELLNRRYERYRHLGVYEEAGVLKS